jgi:hypothetical protein
LPALGGAIETLYATRPCRAKAPTALRSGFRACSTPSKISVIAERLGDAQSDDDLSDNSVAWRSPDGPTTHCLPQSLPIPCAGSSLAPADLPTNKAGSIVGRFEMTDDGLHSLRAFRARLNDQLMKMPEYRAIAVIDRTIQEISEIYGVSVSETGAAPASIKPAATPISRLPEARSISEAAQSRIAMAIAEAIESNVSQLRTQRLPQAAPYTLVSAAS